MKKYIINTSWLMAERIFRIAASFLVTIYVARYLGPTNYGLLNYSISFVMLFSFLSTLGLDGILVRDLINFPQKRSEFLGTAFYLKLIGAGIAILSIFMITSFGSPDTQTKLLVRIISIGLIFQAFNVIDFHFQAKVLSKYVVYAQFAQVLISSSLKILLVYYQCSLTTFGVVILLESIVLSIFLIIFYCKNSNNFSNWQFNPAIGRQLLTAAFPLILSDLIICIYMRIDQILIKKILGPSELGYYAAALNLCEVWYFIPMLISASLFPAVVEAKRINTDLYYARLQRLYSLMTFLAFLIMIPMFIFGEKLIVLFFGMEFMSAAPVLKIYIWACIFTFLGVASGKWLLAENLTKFFIFRSLAGGVTNIALNLLLIPRWGIVGAAFSALATSIAAAYLSDLFAKETRIAFIMKSKSFMLNNLFKQF